MCQFCDDNQRKPVECTDCSRPICLNVNQADATLWPMLITAAGQVLCEECGEIGSSGHRIIGSSEESGEPDEALASRAPAGLVDAGAGDGLQRVGA